MTELSDRAQRLLEQARTERPSEGQRLRVEQALRRRLQIAGQAAGVLGASLSAAAATSTAVSGTAVSGTAVTGTAVTATAVTGTAVTGTAVTGTAVTGTAVTGTAVTGTAGASTAASGALAASAVGSGAVAAPSLGLAAVKVTTALGSSTGIVGAAGGGAAGAGIAGMSVASIGAKLVVSAVIGIAGASVGHEIITRVAPVQSVSMNVAEVAAPAQSSNERQHDEATNPAELSRTTLFPDTATSEHPAPTVAPVEAPVTPHASTLSASSPASPSPASPSPASPSPASPSPAASPVQRPGKAGKGHPSAGEPRASEPQRLAQEVSDLEQAQQLLGQGRPERAIALLEESQRKHAPAGALRGLSTERSALLALSYCAAHDPARRARGKELARQFLLAHPNSPLSARVRSECNSD